MPSTCKTCDTVVPDRKALREHQKCHYFIHFVCDECGKAYTRRSHLNQHVRIQHMNEFFECAHCSFKCGRKFVLKRHILTRHDSQQCTRKEEEHKDKEVHSARKYVKKGNSLSTQKFECTECKKVFTFKQNLTRHVNFHHKDNTRDQLHECTYCLKAFRDGTNLRRHIKVCRTKHQEDQSPAKERLYTCLVSGCETVHISQHAMLEHYKRIHNVALQYESLEFDSKEKFDEWRVDLQRSSACQFSVSKVWKKPTSSNWRMQCHRTGMQPVEKENRQRFHKLGGSKKLNGFCPAEIVLKESKTDGSCRVTIQKTHVGHCNDSHEELKFLSIDKKRKSDIGSKLAPDVPLSRILPNYQTSTPTSKNVEWNETINYDDIANVAAALGLNTKYPAPFTDDPQNVSTFIDEHQQSILFYKAEDSDDTDFGVLKKKDFALVFMSQFQENLLKKFGDNVITYNATHKTNPNDFLLHSIMVLDDDRTGVAVAFLLSNRNDGTVLELFLHSVKKRVGLLTPQTVMTNMQASFHNAFEVVMQVPQFSLWYSWHVYEQWRQNQKKIKCPEKRKCVLMTLYELSQITDMQIFQMKLEIFINDTDPDLQSFIQYFKTTYAMKTSYWAYCYRIGTKIETNMINESFHSFLKGKICGKKKIKTVYECLQCIETYVSIKENSSTMQIIRSQRMQQKIRVLRTRHHTAVKEEGLYTIHSFSSSENECSHTWLISSLEKEERGRKKKVVNKNDVSELNDDESINNNGRYTQEEDGLQLYIVERHIDFNKQGVSCIECSICKVALEEYSCTCIDYLMKYNLCKHIHAVVMYGKKNDCQCICELQSGPIIVYNIELVSSHDMDDDENDDECCSNSINPSDEDLCDEDYIRNLKDQLHQKIDDINDEEKLKNILQFIISLEDEPAPFEEKDTFCDIQCPDTNIQNTDEIIFI